MVTRHPNDEFEDVYAAVMSGKTGATKPKKLGRLKDFRSKRKAKKLKKKQQWQALENQAAKQRQTYNQTMFGNSRIERLRANVARPRQASYHTIAIQIPALNFRRTTGWLKKSKKAFIVLACLFLAAALLYGGTKGYLTYRNKKAETPAVPQASTLAPRQVFTPRNLPPGFTVGSGTQSLENGAMLYTIFDDEGRSIHVTQQAKPDEFDENMLIGAQKFTTPNGTGYVTEDAERISGFLFTQDTWILLNAQSGVSQDKLVEVILSLGA